MHRVEHDRVMEILAQVMELPAPRREAHLESTCHGEPELRREVEDLLNCVVPAERAFDVASQELARADPDQIGPYANLEAIGEGGMAIVYRAQQLHPVRRTVALKLIKLGMDTRQFVARFEAERQALALIDHPNVARVFDAGSTDTGRPYFVMEYVPGRSILEYCDEQNLNLRRRLEVFIDVCDAVEHAHRKGIIHRDIKDSNVLVTEVDGRAVPKVIDFGVAKAIMQPLTNRTFQTEQGQLIGTPEYMSPEQAERGMIDVDTRSDVYSLGVLLYELIAGVPPIPSDVLRGAGYEHVQRMIRETEPDRPSTRLSTLVGSDATRIAQRRGTALPTLIRSLRHELEWIPLKAMRKDREQRYRSAAELADEIRSYLDGRPLLAGPESRWYRTRKFLRRHKAGMAASGAMLLLLIAGIIATTVQAVRATRAEAIAETRRDEVEVVVQFLTEDVLGAATPHRVPDKAARDLIVRTMLDPTAQVVTERFGDRPLVEARIQHILGTGYLQLGSPEPAEKHARRALELYRTQLGDEDPQTLSSFHSLASVMCELGRFTDAEPLARQVLEARRRSLGDQHPQTAESLYQIAWVLQAQGRLREAEPLCRQALAASRHLHGDPHERTLIAQTLLSVMLKEQGRLAEGEGEARQACDGWKRVLGADHPRTLSAMSSLASILQAQGKIADVEAIYRQVLDGRRRTLGDEHRDTLGSIVDLAGVLQAQGKFAEAEMLCRETLDRARRLVGDDHRDIISYTNNLAFLLIRQGKIDEAEPLVNDAARRATVAWGPDHLNTLACAQNMAYVLQQQGRFAEAEAVYRDVLERRRKVAGDDLVELFATMRLLCDALKAQDREAEAEPLYAEMFHRAQASSDSHRSVPYAMSLYPLHLAKTGRYEQAEPALRAAYEQVSAAGLRGSEAHRKLLLALAETCDHTNRPDEASAWRAELHAIEAATAPATGPA